ncbi:MAG TPA: hypothetical protein VD908_18300, partial [Cytophagales bacterium]|nr:hypothetical protein [Cytophagales bacterium]
PEWVKEWIEKRQEKEEKKTESAEKPVDEKAQAKRADARAKKVSQGVEEISLWIKDLIRNGLISVPEKAYSFWQDPAARMVDAQAPGLSGMIRGLAGINYFKEGWQGDLLHKLVQIYLVTEGYKKIGQLPEQLQNEVKSLIGWSQSQEELKNSIGIKDKWLVMSKQSEQQDNLFIQTHWLYGENSLRHALVLNFYHKSQPTDLGLIPGTAVDGEIVFYPGSYQLRAIVKERKATYPIPEPSTFLPFLSIQHQFTEVLTQSPWVDRVPAFVEKVVPHQIDNKWFLIDRENSSIEIDKTFTGTWKLMAIAGGKPINVYGLYSKNSFSPLVIWQESRYLQL